MQGTCREHAGNMQEYSGNIQWTFREYAGNIQGTFREHSVNIQGTFREHSTSSEHLGNIQHPVNIEGTFNMQETLMVAHLRAFVPPTLRNVLHPLGNVRKCLRIWKYKEIYGNIRK